MHKITKNFIEALDSLAEGNIISRRNGICVNIQMYIEHHKSGRIAQDCYVLGYSRIIGEVAQHWPKYSGDMSYPVPSPDWDIPAEEYYDCNYLLWNTNTTYGKDRIELLEFIRSNPDLLDKVIVDRIQTLSEIE